MIEITTQQEYINNVLFDVQCCLAELHEKICLKEQIGACTDELWADIKMLYAYLHALTKHNLDEDEDSRCLTNSEINRILGRIRVICNDCCIERLDEE